MVSSIGWVQAGDIWALRVPHFYVCPKSACCSYVRRGLEARLHCLLSILNFLWRELFFDFPFFYGLLPLGAGLYLMVGFAFFQPTLLLLSFPIIPFCHSCCDIIWPNLAGPLWACRLFFPQWLNMVIGSFITLLTDSSIPFASSWASLVHLLSLDFLDLFPNSVFPWVFTNSSGLSRPNYLIPPPWGSWARHQPFIFFTCITLGLLWPILTFLHHILPIGLSPGSFKSVCFLKAHFFISWICDPLFLPLGLNGFSIFLPTLFCPCCWVSSFYLDSPKWSSTICLVYLEIQIHKKKKKNIKLVINYLVFING